MGAIKGRNLGRQASGTGGLLIIFASELENNNQITAQGISAQQLTAAAYRYLGAGSGGGSINIFLKVDSNKIGIINVDGGGGCSSGGKGCISIGNISTGIFTKR